MDCKFVCENYRNKIGRKERCKQKAVLDGYCIQHYPKVAFIYKKNGGSNGDTNNGRFGKVSNSRKEKTYKNTKLDRPTL